MISIRSLAGMLARHPRLCLLVFAILTTGAALVVALRGGIEMDLAALLPEKSRVASATRLALEDFGSFDYMLCAVKMPAADGTEAKQEELFSAVDEVAGAVMDERFLRAVEWKLDPSRMAFSGKGGDARLLALLTERDWNRFESRFQPEELRRRIISLKAKLRMPMPTDARKALLSDPLGFHEILDEKVRIVTGPLRLNFSKGYFLSEDGKLALLLLLPVKRSTDKRFSGELREFLDDTRAGLFLDRPEWKERFTIQFVGPHYEAAADLENVSRDIWKTSSASLAAILLLFFFAFRRPEALLFVAIPLVAGIVWAAAIATIQIGKLNQVTMIFSAILIGRGIDFSIHLYNRYLEEIRVGVPNAEALRSAIQHTGPGIIAGGLATAIAFFAMMSTSFRGFRDLGFVTGTGILCCLATVSLVLPSLLLLFAPSQRGLFTTRPLATFGLKRIYFTVANYPRMTILCSLAVCAWLGAHASGVEFDPGIANLRQPTKEYQLAVESIEEHAKLPGDQLIVMVEGATLEQALEANDLVYRKLADPLMSLPAFSGALIDSLRVWYPSKASQMGSLKRMAEQPLERYREDIEKVGTEMRLRPATFAAFLDKMASYRDAARGTLDSGVPPIRYDGTGNAAMLAILQRWVFQSATGYRVMTQIYPPTGKWRNETLDLLESSMREGLPVEPQVTGIAIIERELSRLVVRDLAKAVLFTLAVVSLFLVLHFGGPGRAVLAMLPVLLAAVAVLGCVKLMGIRLNYLNIIAMPMVLGVAVDSGIHLIQRFAEAERADLRLAVERTGRAVVITGLTTMFGFGSLALADFQAIRELGVISFVGIAITLVISLVMLPAILKLTDPSAFEEGGPGDELG